MKHLGNSTACPSHCGQIISSKRGSSLALVMMLSAVLVLLGAALLPMVITADSEGLEMEKRYEKYLLSRSAIEYAKGELTCLMRAEQPCTFAVFQSDSGFRAVRKRDGDISINSAYADCIDFDPLGRADDTQDRPKASTTGDKVVAICAVVPTESQRSPFEITILSFVKGELSLIWDVEIKEGGAP